MSEENGKKIKFKFLKDWSFLKKLKQVKHIGLIVTIIFVLILLIILFGDFNFWSSNSSATTSGTSTTYITSFQYTNEIETKLKSIVSKIKGAGTVEVMVTLDTTGALTLASNDQTTNSSGTTTVSVSPVILEQNGQSVPIVIGESLPKIKGVVVVSSGANNISVKLNIQNAVQTLLDLDDSQIQILAGE